MGSGWFILPIVGEECPKVCGAPNVVQEKIMIGEGGIPEAVFGLGLSYRWYPYPYLCFLLIRRV